MLYVNAVHLNVLTSPKGYEILIAMFNFVTFTASSIVLYLPIKEANPQAFVLKFIVSMTIQILAFLAFLTIGVVVLKSKLLALHTLSLFGALLLLHTVWMSVWRNKSVE